MRYKLLGKSGLRVSELCLGTMTFGEDWDWGASQDESRQIFDAFVEEGIRSLATLLPKVLDYPSAYLNHDLIVQHRVRS